MVKDKILLYGSFFQSQKDLNHQFEILDKDFSSYELIRALHEINAVVILAELPWKNNKYSDFYGFELASEMRLIHKIQVPIIIVSFLPESFFQNNDKYNILKARGTYFLQLPIEPETLINFISESRSLSLAALADISSLLLNKRYLVDRFTHDIRFEMDKDELVVKAKNILSKLPTELYHVFPWEELIKELADAKVSEEKFYLLKKELIIKLNSILSPDSEGSVASKKYRILLLEDNPEDARIILQALEPYYYITRVESSDKAIQIIDNDQSNEFHALICDWRLLEKGTDKQQSRQGYEVMEYAASKRFYALFSLTSFDDDSRRFITPYLSCSFTPLTKDFEKGSGLWKLYIPIINQRIEENLSVLAGLPTGEGWYKQSKPDYKTDKQGNKKTIKKVFDSFHQQYLEKRNNESFTQFNLKISELSAKIWNYYQQSLEPVSNRALQDISTKWGVELNRDIQNLFVLRRVYLALWYSQSRLPIIILGKENPVINIYSILRNKDWDDMVNESDSTEEVVYKKLLSAAKAFVSKLAIETKSLPSGILPEERAWLDSIGIDVTHGNDVDYYENDDE